MPQTILKSICFFFWLLAIIFSFNSYASDPDPARGGAKNRKERKKRPTYKESEFMESLKPHFVSEQNAGYDFVLNRFDANKPASQSFEKECPGRLYNSFKEGMAGYYGDIGYPSSVSIDLKSFKEKMEAGIIRSVKDCEAMIYKNYKVIDYVFNSLSGAWKEGPFDFNKLPKFYQYFDYDQVRRVFGSYDEDSPEEIKQLHSLFFSGLPQKYNDFYDCFFETVKGSKSLHGDNTGGLGNNISFEVNFHFGEKLKALKENDCFEKRKKFLALMKNAAFKNLVQVPSLCENPQNPQNNCVASLRELVGFNPKAKSFFQACAEEQGKTSECCLSDSECKHFPPGEVQQAYQSLLQPILQGSGNRDICHSQSSETKTARSHLAKKAIEICEQSANTCEEFCKTDENYGLSHFKRKFLKCFSLPTLSETAYAIHSKNACAGQIKEIQARFSLKLKAKSYFPNQNISLESLSNSSSVDSLIAEVCQKPLKDIKKNPAGFNARVEGIWYNACNESPANQQEGQNDSQFQAQYPSHTVRSSRQAGSSSSGFYPDQQRWPPDNPDGIPPGVGGHSSHSNSPWTDEGTGPTGGNSKNNMDSQFFPPGSDSKASEAQKGPEDSTASFFDSNTEDEYKRPEDPSRPFTHSVSVGPGGVGSLANINRDLFDSESGVKRGNKGVKGSAGTSSRSPSSSKTGSSHFSGSSGSYGSHSSVFRRMRRSMARSIKKPLRNAYIALFGDPRKKTLTVKDVFNINGPEVDLMRRQHELTLMFCLSHDCGASKEELDNLERKLRETATNKAELAYLEKILKETK